MGRFITFYCVIAKKKTHFKSTQHALCILMYELTEAMQLITTSTKNYKLIKN